MIFIKSSLIVFLISFTPFVFGQEEAWVRVDYKECLSEHLPCDCLVPEIIPFINYNRADTAFFLNYKIVNYTSLDTISFDVMQQSKFINGDDDFLISHIDIIGDTLYYSNLKNQVTHAYVSIKRWSNFESEICIEYLNTLLLKNDSPDLNTILKSDTLFCNCDLQFGISRIHNNKDVWILEINDNYLFIFKWKYPKDFGFKAKKKLYKKIQLKVG